VVVVQAESVAPTRTPLGGAVFADPAPLGLAGFGMTTFMLSVFNAGLLPMTLAGPPRVLRRLVLAYGVRCARDDARQRQIRTPLGVWACHLCEHVSLNIASFDAHLVHVHA
jgi:GPR1/FUN34/yaaH family